MISSHSLGTLNIFTAIRPGFLNMPERIHQRLLPLPLIPWRQWTFWSLKKDGLIQCDLIIHIGAVSVNQVGFLGASLVIQ